MMPSCKSPLKWNNSAKTWMRSMNLPSSKLKLKLMSQKREPRLPVPLNNTTVEPLNQLMLRTNTFSPPKLNALDSSLSTEVTPRFATGARRQRPHQWSGNGTPNPRSGIDGMTTNGITGAHPREDSPPTAGPGIRDSGITTAGSSSTNTEDGTDSRDTNGSIMVLESQSSQRFQEAERSADLSTYSRSSDSQAPSVPRDFQDAELDQEEAQSTTTGKTEVPASSLEVDSFTKRTLSVKKVDPISGLELSDAFKAQSSPRRD